MTSKSSCARSIRIVFQALGYPLPRSPTPATNTFVGLLSGARFIARRLGYDDQIRSEEHTSELQSLMRISYAVFCLKTKKQISPSTASTHQYDHKHSYIHITIQTT